MLTYQFIKRLTMPFILSLFTVAATVVYANPSKSVVKEPSANAISHYDTATVIRVIDGDTYVLSGDKRVRMMGIDTPEKGEPFANAATEFADSALLGKTVQLEIGKEPQDKYGRILAYVFLGKTLINEVIIRRGFARVYIFSGKERYNGRLISAQNQARKEKIGVWSLPAPEPEAYYIAPGGSYRFHRPLCPLIKNINAKKARKFKSRGEALDEGLSPCRECRP
jgi:micrococcal nuclease